VNFYNEHDPFAAAWLRELIVPQVAAAFIRAAEEI